MPNIPKLHEGHRSDPGYYDWSVRRMSCTAVFRVRGCRRCFGLPKIPPAVKGCPNDGTVRQVPQDSVPWAASGLGIVIGPQPELPPA